MPIPTYDNLFNPLLTALHQLGSSASISELEEQVAEIIGLSENDLQIPHNERNSQFAYRLAWARTYLKKVNLIDNSSRGVWSLTAEGQRTTQVDKVDVRRRVQELNKKDREEKEADSEESLPDEMAWQDEVLTAVKSMDPEAFERLCQRVLRESGFTQVEITGKSGDGGIDGHGVVKLGSILSFHVFFQCKRFKQTVSSPVVRDFRGAMVGRADKGIIITTGTFTREARAEALRDGAPPLDLIEGDDLVKMLKQYRLGVSVREVIVEEVNVNADWFVNF